MGMDGLRLACYVRGGGGVWRRVYECEGDVGRLSVRWVRGCAERLVWERVLPLPDAVAAVVDGELRLRLVRVDVMAGEVCVWRGYLVRAVHGGGVYRYECWGYRLWSPDGVSYRVCAGARADTVFLDVLRQVMGRAGALLWDQPCGWYQALCGMELPAQLFVESPVGEVWDWLEQRTGYAVVEGERWDVNPNAGYAHWLVDWGAGEELLAVEVSDADVVWDVDYSGVANRLRFVGGAPAVANRLSNGRFRGELLSGRSVVLADDDFALPWQVVGGVWLEDGSQLSGRRAARLEAGGKLVSPPLPRPDLMYGVWRVRFYMTASNSSASVAHVWVVVNGVRWYRATATTPARSGYHLCEVYLPYSDGLFAAGADVRLELESVGVADIDGVSVEDAALSVDGWEVSDLQSVVGDDDFVDWTRFNGASLAAGMFGGQALRLGAGDFAERRFLHPETTMLAVRVGFYGRVPSGGAGSVQVRVEAYLGGSWQVRGSWTASLSGDSWQWREQTVSVNAVPIDTPMRLVVAHAGGAAVDVDAVTGYFAPSVSLPSYPLFVESVGALGERVVRLLPRVNWNNAYDWACTYGIKQRVRFEPKLNGRVWFDLVVQDDFDTRWTHALLEVGGVRYVVPALDRAYAEYTRFGLALDANEVSEVWVHLLMERLSWADNRGAGLAGAYLAVYPFGSGVPSIEPWRLGYGGEVVESRYGELLSDEASGWARWVRDNWASVRREVRYPFRSAAELGRVRGVLESRYGEPESVVEVALPYDGDARLLMPHRYRWVVGGRAYKVAELEYRDGVLQARLGRAVPSLPELIRS